MKRGIKACLILAGTLLVLGLVLFLTGAAMGGGRESVGYYEDHWEDLFEDRGWGPILVNSGKKQQVESGELTGVTSVDADLSLGDLYIREGNGFALSLEWNLSDYTMSYRMDRGVLRVEDEGGRHKNGGSLTVECKMVLTVPAGTELDTLDLSTDMGDIQVDAVLTAGEADLSTNMGDVTCRGLLAREMELQSELGDVSVTIPSECEGLSYHLSTSLGEVLLNGRTQSNPTLVIEPEEKYYLAANTSLGDVSLQFSE